MKSLLLICSVFITALTACHHSSTNATTKQTQPNNIQPTPVKAQQYLVVLGIAQDAGYPQAGCTKNCCKDVWQNTHKKKLAVSLGVIDQQEGKKWMIEATPDFREQLQVLNKFQASESMLPQGIFLTHGHIGHYSGLIHLGREAMGAQGVAVYVMPRMRQYLTNNGPWSQLVSLKNIYLQPIQADSSFQLSQQIQITPIQVPHRDEFTETVGYQIKGSKKTVLFIPDINKWQKWELKLTEVIKTIDIALIDGTFYKNGEIANRDMSQIPHPFVEETTALLKDIPASEKSKVYFIHFNHTNPLINPGSKERKEVNKQGFNIAQEGQIIRLDQ
ncbi:MBL fold metallo-hydrolase [uncultured Microscilla sp.]|uniref:MBL fold metallo-hydrolase n=1 Tax=uncultured Microscilla sp. TaxID=432653 RepID=UPI0026064E05|nr:MBL fold metallo-hydrolase [uncultured Microscilla sp.]